MVKINIPDGARKIIHALEENGYEAYVVGGCVRDSILGRDPNDWDICTSATPDEMTDVFSDKHIIGTGLQHGTLTVVMDGVPYEVTTYRIDGEYSDNRRPDTVTFTTKLEEDLKRRDFTINAMAYNDRSGLIDPYDGLKDLDMKRIKCVGSPKERFHEDALRVLRAVRFAAQLDFLIDFDTLEEAYFQKGRLKNISIERINSEFCKIVKSNNFGATLSLYREIFYEAIPELDDPLLYPYGKEKFILTADAIQNSERYGYIYTDDFVKLAIFFHGFGRATEKDDNQLFGNAENSAEITDKIMRRLRFDNDTRVKVVELVKHHRGKIEEDKVCIKRWLNKIGELQFIRMISIRKVFAIQNEYYNTYSVNSLLTRLFRVQDITIRIIENKECFSLKDLAVTGDNLIALAGYKPGKELGDALNKLLDLVICGTENDKEVLLAHARRMQVKKEACN